MTISSIFGSNKSFSSIYESFLVFINKFLVFVNAVIYKYQKLIKENTRKSLINVTK